MAESGQFKTGKAPVTLTWTSTISGTWSGYYQESSYAVGGGDPPPGIFALGYLQMGVGGWYCRVAQYVNTGATADYGVLITAYNGTSTDTEHFDVSSFPLPNASGPSHQWTKPWTGTWTITCTVEEYIDITQTLVTNTRFIPWDPPHKYAGRLVERLVVGEPITASLTINGVTASVSDNAAIATEVSRNLIGSWEYSLGNAAYALTSTEPTINGNPVSAPVTISHDVWTTTVESGMSLYGVNPNVSPKIGDLNFTIWRPRAYSMELLAKAEEHPYPNPLTFAVDRYSGYGLGAPVIAVGGQATDSYSQRCWDVQAVLSGTVFDDELDEKCPVKAYVDSASLAANHEDDKEHDPTHITLVRDTRAFLRGFWATIGTVVHATEVAVDTFDDATETGGNWYTSDCPYGYWVEGADVAIDAPDTDRMRAVYTGAGTGTISRYYPLNTDTETYPPPIEWTGYRWLRVKIRCTEADGTPIDDQVCTLTVHPNTYRDGWNRIGVTDKTWTIEGRKTGEDGADGWVTRYLDTCSPATPTLPTSEGGAHCAEKSIAIYVPGETPRFDDWWYEEAVQEEISAGQEGNIDSRWPLPQIDGVMSGVTLPAFVEPEGYSGLTSDVPTVPGIEISALAPNVYYDLKDMSLERRYSASVDLMPTRRWWARVDRNWESVAQADEVHWHKWSQEPDDWDQALKSWSWYARNVLGNVDGRQSVERPYAFRAVVQVPDPGYGNYIEYTALDTRNVIEGIGGLSAVNNIYYDPPPADGDPVTVLLGYVRESAGWSATENAASIAGRAAEAGAGATTVAEWMNANRTAFWLAGGGWRAINGSWVCGLGIGATSAADLVIQMLLETIQWYPDCGDSFGFGGGDGLSLVLRVAKVLRGEGHGIVLTPTGAVSKDVVVTLSPDAGTGTSVASTGAYITGLPTGRGHVDHDLLVDEETAAIPYHSLHARKRSRAHFVHLPGSGDESEPGRFIWLLRDYTGRRFIHYCNNAGALLCREDGDTDQVVATRILDPGPDCSYPNAHLGTNYHEVTYLLGTQPKLARSPSHGRTWDKVDITGTYDAFASCLHQKRMVVAGFKSAGPQWYCRVGKLNADGTYTWGAEVSMAISNASEYGHLSVRPDGAIEFAYLDTSGTPHVLTGTGVALDGTGTWTA